MSGQENGVALRGEDAMFIRLAPWWRFEPWNTANVWTPKKKGRDQIICLEEKVKKILAEHNGFKICDRSSQASCKWAFPTFCEPKFVYLPVWARVMNLWQEAAILAEKALRTFAGKVQKIAFFHSSSQARAFGWRACHYAFQKEFQ